MPRKKAVTPTVLLKAWISPELKAKVYLLLASEVEGRIPLGDISDFVSERLREHFESAELDLSLHGGPQGYFVRGQKDMVEWLRQRLNTSPAGVPGWGGANAKP